MKADDVQVFCNATLCDKDEKNWDSIETESGTRKENLNRILCDLRDGDRKEDLDCIKAYSHSSTNRESFEKDSVFYMGKNVNEFDVPEIVVCYKENTCNVVKDICVDEGVPVQDKFLFDDIVDEKVHGSKDLVKMEELGADVLSTPVRGTEKPKTNLNNISNEVEEQSDDLGSTKFCSDGLNQKGEINNDLTAKMTEMNRDMSDVSKSSLKDYADVELVGKCDSEDLVVIGEGKNNAKSNIAMNSTDMPALDVPIPSVENDSKKEISIRRDSEDLMLREGEAKDKLVDKTTNDVSRESLRLGDIFSLEDNYKPFERMSSGPKEEYSKSSSKNRSAKSAASVSNAEGSDVDNQVYLSEKRPDVIFAAEKSNKSSSEEKGNGDKNTNLANLSLVSVVSQESSNLDYSDPQNPVFEKDESKPNFLLGDSNDQIFSSTFKNGFGEASFSAAGLDSEIITHSGPIAYSRSLSVRSDSTTSVRSFAFPVLRSEWNSSPVRMAKADRRHLWRQKRWRKSLLCCKF